MGHARRGVAATAHLTHAALLAALARDEEADEREDDHKSEPVGLGRHLVVELPVRAVGRVDGQVVVDRLPSEGKTPSRERLRRRYTRVARLCTCMDVSCA